MIQNLIIIFNLFILESMLSVDNATALAAMVKHLPYNERNKALRYGLLGAYLFRGICLFTAAWLVKILWLKIAGGLYLLWLAYGFFKSKSEEESEDRYVMRGFWFTVLSVEILDLSLSIDNIFAAVALTDNIYLIITGVFIGILAMRFVAGWFVSLMYKYPSLETSAFVVIALLGAKLILSGICNYVPSLLGIQSVMENRSFDLIFSATMMLIFFIPLIPKNLWQKR